MLEGQQNPTGTVTGTKRRHWKQGQGQERRANTDVAMIAESKGMSEWTNSTDEEEDQGSSWERWNLRGIRESQVGSRGRTLNGS